MNRYQNGTEPIPGYRILDFLGEGSYGAVYKARGPGGVENAMKFISLDNKQGLKEFKSVSLVKKLHHANLVPIFAIWLRDSNGNVMDETSGGDSGSINLMGNKELVIAMGLGNKSLAQALDETKGKGIPPEKLLRYMEDAAKGIDYLNEEIHEPNNSSIIHCDIKPGNLLILGGSVQVCDYGVAKALSKKMDLKKTMGAGTPAYAAPELINNDPTTQTDQYSLAITYIELRTGLLPFEESKALVSNLMGQLDLSRLTPPEQDVIRQATHKQPVKRFGTCLEFVEALKIATGVTFGGRTGAVPMPQARRIASTEEFPVARTIDDLLQKGQMLVPEHRLVRRLGEGGYGQVWEAQGPYNVNCALKVVKRTESKGQHEYEIISKIKNITHRHLMEPLDIWLLASDGSRIRSEKIGQPDCPSPAAVVIKTKLADKNLFQRMRECQQQGMDGIAPSELMVYMHQSAAAIDHLNNNNIQHRDIKPENILLMGDQAFVSDFGLAKLVDDSGNATQSSSSGMTLDYAAPELLDEKRVTLWTDQYSLALSYIMLRTGRLPYPHHASQSAKIAARLNGDLDLSGVSPGEREVLKIALDRDPGRRFDSCALMASRLGSAVGLGSGPLGVSGSGPQQALIGSGTYPPMPPRSSTNMGRGSGVVGQPAARGSGFPQEMQVLVETQDYSYTPAYGGMGTVGFGGTDTAPIGPKRESVASNPWKSDNKARESTGFRESYKDPKKSSMMAPLIAGLVMLLIAGGAAVYFFVIKKDNDAGTGTGGTSVVNNDGGNKPITISPQPEAGPSAWVEFIKLKDKQTVNNVPPPGDKDFTDLLTKIGEALAKKEDVSDTKKKYEELTKGKDKKYGQWLTNLLAAYKELDTTPITADVLITKDSTVEAAAAKLFEGDQKSYLARYKELLSGWLPPLIPDLNTKEWAELARINLKAKEPSQQLLTECWLELSLDGQTPAFPRPAGLKPSNYVNYLDAIALTIGDAANLRQAAKAAKLLIKDPLPVEIQKAPHRADRLWNLFSQQVSSMRTPVKAGQPADELLAPFPAAEIGEVKEMIAAAMKLSPFVKPETAKNPALKYQMLLVSWMDPTADKAALAKLVDELQAANYFTELEDKDRARALVITAQSRGASVAERKQALKAYQDVIAVSNRNPSPVPPAAFYKWVLEPLSAESFSQSFASLDLKDETRRDAVTLLAGTGAVLRRNAARYDSDKVLPEPALKLSLKLFDQAASLSKSTKYHAWCGIVGYEIDPLKSEAELRKRLDFGEVEEASGSVEVLRGLIDLLRARTAPDDKIRFQSAQQAMSSFRKAVELGEAGQGLEKDALQIAYRLGASSGIRYANYGKSLPNNQKKDALEQAVKWGRVAEKTPETMDVLGCALEDLAWLLKNPKRFSEEKDADGNYLIGTYPAAVTTFSDAMKANAADKTSALMLAAEGLKDARARARLHLGRCYFRWAEDLSQNSSMKDPAIRGKVEQLLNLGRDEFRESLKQLNEPSFDRAEGAIFFGRLSELQAKLERSELKVRECTELAEKLYNDAYADSKSAGAEDCRPIALRAITDFYCEQAEIAKQKNMSARAQALSEKAGKLLKSDNGAKPSAAYRALLRLKSLRVVLTKDNYESQSAEIAEILKTPLTGLLSQESFVVPEMKLEEARILKVQSAVSVGVKGKALSAFREALKLAEAAQLSPPELAVYRAELALFLPDTGNPQDKPSFLAVLSEARKLYHQAMQDNPAAADLVNWKKELLLNLAYTVILTEDASLDSLSLVTPELVAMLAELNEYFAVNKESYLRAAFVDTADIVVKKAARLQTALKREKAPPALSAMSLLELDLIQDPSLPKAAIIKTLKEKVTPALEGELNNLQLSPFEQQLYRSQLKRLESRSK